MRQVAKRLSRETGFSLDEIENMPLSDMLWWLTE